MCMQSPLTVGWRYRTAQSSTKAYEYICMLWFYSAVKLLSSLLMYQVDRHPCIGYIKHQWFKLNEDWRLINILSPHPVMLKKNFDQHRGDVLTDRPGDVLAIHLGTFWLDTGKSASKPVSDIHDDYFFYAVKLRLHFGFQFREYLLDNHR